MIEVGDDDTQEASNVALRARSSSAQASSRSPHLVGHFLLYGADEGSRETAERQQNAS
jgi:hypothetical protein